MSVPVESDCTTGQNSDNWKLELVKRHFGVMLEREGDGGEKRFYEVSGDGGDIAEEKVEKERVFKIVEVDDTTEDNDAHNDVNASDKIKSVNADGSGEWIEKEQDVSTVSVIWNDCFKVENKADDHQNQDEDVLMKAGYVQYTKEIENKVETVIFGDHNNVVTVEAVDGIIFKKVGKDEHLPNLVQEVEDLAADELGHNYDECVSGAETEEVDNKADDHQNQDVDVLYKAGYVKNANDIENKVETGIFGDDNKVVKVEDIDGINLKKVGKDEHLPNLLQEVEVLVADKLGLNYDECAKEVETIEADEKQHAEGVKVTEIVKKDAGKLKDLVELEDGVIKIEELKQMDSLNPVECGQIELYRLIQAEDILECQEVEEKTVSKINGTVKIINIEEENVCEDHADEFVKVGQATVLTENIAESADILDILDQILFNMFNIEGNALEESDNHGKVVGCEPVHQDVDDREHVIYDSNVVVTEIIKSLIDNVLHEAEFKAAVPAPIDASKVTFSCLDIRLKTGFPAPATKKNKNCTLQKNCVSIILTGDRGVIMKSLALLESVTDKAKFVQTSAVVALQVRRDLVFTTETSAANFCSKVSKYFLRNVSLKMITLSEADIGYPMAPVLTEGEIMYILEIEEGGNIMDVFDGNVEMDRRGNICFTFRNLAILNLFLYSVATPNISSLGLLRRKMDRIKNDQELKDFDRKLKVKKVVPEMLRLIIVHPLYHPHELHKKRRDGTFKTGWGWDKLEKKYNFRITDAMSRTEKVIKFRSKLDLFEFWIRETRLLMTKVNFYSLENENETKVKKRLVKEEKERQIKDNKLDDKEQSLNKQLEFWKQKVLEIKSKARGSQIKVNKKEDEVNHTRIKLKKQDSVLKNLISQRIELEEKIQKISKLRQGLSEKQETVLVGIQEIKAQLKKETEAIVELEEKLYEENELRRNILDKIAREAGKKMNEDFARQTLEKEMNSLSNLETFEADVYRMYPHSLALPDQRSATRVSRYEAPRMSLSNILSLTWKSENQEGSNYFPCLLAFLRSISSFVVAVVEVGEDILLEFSSYGCQELNKVLSVHARDERRDWTQLDALQPRYRCKPDELNNNYCFDFIMRPECISMQSKDQLVQEIKAAGGTIHYVAHKVRCTFSTKHEYLRALTSKKLVRYHIIYLSRDNLEQTWGTGDNNYYRGSVCLTESNMLSIYWIGEEEAGYADCLSAFLKDSRIKEVLLGSNIKLLIIFHNLSAMITSLHDYCQSSCNTLELLIRMPVRCKLVSRSGCYSLLCPSTAVKQDLHSYRHMCRMEVEPRRICSKFKLCLVLILRERDFQLKYPEIVFNYTHFLCKDGDTLPRRTPPAEPVHHDHNLDADDDDEIEGEAPPPGDQREVTSDYEESLISEPAGGDARF